MDMDHAFRMRLLTLLLCGLAGLAVCFFAKWTPSAVARRKSEMRILEPPNGSEYLLWLARQQGYDLSHRTGAGKTHFLVLKAAPHYWPPKLSGPIGNISLPAGYPPPTPEQLQGIRKEIRQAENASTGTFIAIFSSCSGMVVGWQAIQRTHEGGPAFVVALTLSIALLMSSVAAGVKLGINERRRQRKFTFSLSPSGKYPPSPGSGDQNPARQRNEGSR
ncbi:hypothetical protein [Streptomyces tubercidicus]|uniref:hypothetical protein n=1 Tax=Streptomyces tubercidicus TaxID=47759 RepID=UPI003467B703